MNIICFNRPDRYGESHSKSKQTSKQGIGNKISIITVSGSYHTP